MIMYCVRVILSLGQDLRLRESSLSLVRLCSTISSTSVGGISKLVVQIYRMDAILIVYWVVGQVRTMMISLMNKSKLNMGEIFKSFLMMPCEMFLRANFSNARSISLISIVRGRFGGLGDVL